MTQSNATSFVRPKLGVVTPLANEQETIDAFLAAVLQHLHADDHIFCVLDNVCKDSTRERIERASRTDPRVVLVWSPENRCVVDAYFRGYREALAAGCEWILEIDGGLSHPPAQIPRFLNAMADGVEYAAGSRFTEGGHFRGRLTRRIVSQGGTFLTNRILGTTMADMTSGFECFTRRALQHVVERGVRSRAHFFQTEIRVMLRDWRCREIPITYSCPSRSVGKASLGEAFSVLWQLRKERREALRAAAEGAPGSVSLPPTKVTNPSVASPAPAAEAHSL